MMASIPFTDFCIPDSVTLSISPVALKKSILNRSWCDLAVWENGEQAEQSARTGWALRDQARVMTTAHGRDALSSRSGARLMSRFMWTLISSSAAFGSGLGAHRRRRISTAGGEPLSWYNIW
jgi:hypothetical protein